MSHIWAWRNLQGLHFSLFDGQNLCQRKKEFNQDDTLAEGRSYFQCDKSHFGHKSSKFTTLVMVLACCILRRIGFPQGSRRKNLAEWLSTHRTFRCHASPPRAAADGGDWTLVRSPREFFLSKIFWPIFFLRGPWGKHLLRGTQRVGFEKALSLILELVRTSRVRYIFKPSFWNHLGPSLGLRAERAVFNKSRLPHRHPFIHACAGPIQPVCGLLVP